jgi:hypothetical protein
MVEIASKGALLYRLSTGQFLVGMKNITFPEGAVEKQIENFSLVKVHDGHRMS